MATWTSNHGFHDDRYTKKNSQGLYTYATNGGSVKAQHSFSVCKDHKIDNETASLSRSNEGSIFESDEYFSSCSSDRMSWTILHSEHHQNAMSKSHSIGNGISERQWSKSSCSSRTIRKRQQLTRSPFVVKSTRGGDNLNNRQDCGSHD